ncbi:GntR family transcriptional regulator [Alicyclobacillus tolerans]|uniref:GntR family transcriptional regulator n=1 Tax=Alicyclobacillus tolerans TaxID=90970 RepID=UPI0023512CBE|nr:GntR family transcriptional regulator [Alicyclobacillus tolerans]MCF8566233.1 GntR family transcriptional regulator [Alicyclobacillus tolerans]
MSPKRPLRDDVKHQVLKRLVRGVLPFGSRINETVLSEELGVSRTPLREALLDLQREGFLRSDTARGFTVRPLSQHEVKETYPILWTLECLALRTDEQIPDVEELFDCNEKMRKAKNHPEQALEYDSEWHAILISKCHSDRLRSMIAELKQTIRRYEYTFMWDAELIERSIEQHQKVINALSEHDIEQAERALQENWRTGMESLLDRF